MTTYAFQNQIMGSGGCTFMLAAHHSIGAEPVQKRNFLSVSKKAGNFSLGCGSELNRKQTHASRRCRNQNLAATDMRFFESAIDAVTPATGRTDAASKLTAPGMGASKVVSAAIRSPQAPSNLRTTTRSPAEKQDP